MVDGTRLANLDLVVAVLQDDFQLQSQALAQQTKSLDSLQSTVSIQYQTMVDMKHQMEAVTTQLIQLGQLIKGKATQSTTPPDGTKVETDSRTTFKGDHTSPTNHCHPSHLEYDSDREEFPFKPKPAQVELTKFNA
ncbi:uncharacterized protein LOC128041691 [Gossypium raimondii]|uniref:uncharacterized protein LOC128041691 n=1 Tax=Gossypium raimondii TaxID=29730 RepID=UPI00227D6B28|nr:uncharacterized protein LOC128041691 [Gossypium raimondii]